MNEAPAMPSKQEIAEYLQSRIAQKKRELAELEEMINRRMKLQADIGAMQHILERELGEPSPEPKLKNGTVDLSAPLPKEVTSLRELGVSEAIRVVLRGKQLRPIEVSNAMTEMGWINTGRVPIGARVAAEMARLYRAGKLEKDAGRYRLAGG